MKAWREISVPHADVLKGTFQQSEFAADITAVREGRSTAEYQDAVAFFQRTFITEGMGRLLTQVAQRLNGKGGEPEIPLQNEIGGGKTHTMLAVFHLASRKKPLKELAGIPALLDQAGLMDVPRAQVAVLDGSAKGPNQPWSHGGVRIHTLWGELAWQLGGEDGLSLVREADATGTSPGKDVLRALLERFAPCVVLIDELVAYVRQFGEGQILTGGTYDSNLSFIQALTEAAKLVPTAIVLASLPQSEIEAGSARSVGALEAVKKTFGRVHALWKPVAAEEAFEIVRRRLFEPIRDGGERDAVCREFAKAYAAEGAKLPSETHEARYVDRLIQAYPIHPEIFDRLYEDWSTLDGFQRTRGVLKLMARVIHRLWQDENQDLMILPGSLPLYDSGARSELIQHLPPGWDAVVERDIDGNEAETTGIDTTEPRFGAVSAARRVARTTFLGSAPASGGSSKATRGVDRARILLGCVQPGQSSAAFSDALNRLCDRLHYLNTSGDKAQPATRFWFDTRANLRREMEDRRGRFDESGEVVGRIAATLKELATGTGLFDGVHPFTPHADIPDDGGLRLVFLPIDSAYSKQSPARAADRVAETIRSNGSKPRYRANRLVFVAADSNTLSRLRDCVQTALAWGSIVDDIKGGRLNIDRLQEEQAKKELETAKGVVPRAARECFKWLLCPVMTSPTDREATVEAFPLNPASGTYAAELTRVCEENELVIGTWSPIHLRNKLRELYWKDDTIAVRSVAVWEDMQKYLYLPRLRTRLVLEQAIQAGAASRDFFGTAYGQNGDSFEGFKFGESTVQLDDTLLLIEPTAAASYLAREKARVDAAKQDVPAGSGHASPDLATAPRGSAATQSAVRDVIGSSPPRARSFFGSIDVNATTAKMKLVSIAEEIIATLSADPDATVKVTVEISAEFPKGASEQTKRAVAEFAATLGFKSGIW